MKHALSRTAVKVLAAGALVCCAPLASAGGHPDVSWSVTIGSSRPGPRIYSPPPVVYVEPRPVYVQPRTVYVRPAPVYYYGAPPVYVEEYGYEKYQRPHHWKHRRHHDWDD